MDQWINGLSDTWIGSAFNLLTSVGGLVALGGVVVIGLVLWSGRYIAKGGGQYGIVEGYVGMIGAGKTTLAVQHCMALARARDAVLLSNIPVLCGKTCKAGVHAFEHRRLAVNDEGLDIPALSVEAFKLRHEGRGLVLLVDEVGVVMPARLWKDFSVSLMWVLQQSRKLTCEWVWTAQDASFVDHQLRSLTAAVHFVRSVPPPSIWRRVNGKRPWLMYVKSYMPTQAPRAHGEADGGKVRDRSIGRRIVRYRRSWEGAFDTDGVVLPSRHLKGAEALVQALEAVGSGRVFAQENAPAIADEGVPEAA